MGTMVPATTGLETMVPGTTGLETTVPAMMVPGMMVPATTGLETTGPAMMVPATTALQTATQRRRVSFQGKKNFMQPLSDREQKMTILAIIFKARADLCN